MKKLTCFLFLTGSAFFGYSQGPGITTPREPSPAASVSQTIGISTVKVDYSRPAVNSRAIWGELVPYGWNVQQFGLRNEAPWRAGANENTVIHFSDAVKVEGQNVPAGDYGLFFVINKDNSGEIILSKETTNWGSFFYDKSQDQMRSRISVKDAPMTERLSYEFTNVTKNGADLTLNWEKKQFPVRIEFAVDDLVMANAERQLKGPTGFNWTGPMSAANYALNNKVGLDKALVWAEQAVNQNRSFPTLSMKSRVQKEMGNTGDADKTMQEAINVSTEAELNNYGYQMLNLKKYDEAVNAMLVNTQRHPNSANTFDSLGEAYALKGDKKNAIINFKKSLALHPADAVKANSEKYLKELGAK